MNILIILILAFITTISYSMVSRSRNRDHKMYHALCSVFSNSMWYLTIHTLVVTDLSFTLFIPYVFGTVAGSLTGSEISIYIERKIGAKT